MDRTADFHSIVDIFLNSGEGKGSSAERRPKPASSPFLLNAVAVFENLKQNDELVQGVNRLSTKKEFSNDPTKAMQELSSVFMPRVGRIQDSIKALKAESESGMEGSHQLQHYKMIVQFLSKSITSQVASFKSALKEHGKHVAERNKRVMQYGGATQTLDSLTAAANSDMATATVAAGGAVATAPSSSSLPPASHRAFGNDTGDRALLRDGGGAKYAMFANKNLMDNRPAAVEKHAPLHSAPPSHPATNDFVAPTGLHHRSANQNRPSGHAQTNPPPGARPKPHSSQFLFQQQASSSPPLHPSSSYPQQDQQLRARRKDDFRLRAAEQVESSIRQMGELFTQMASLVAEQGETITRIEDDVEEGLSNTKEAHQSIQNVYEITKGNRSMILKVFALLLFFILVFLVWT